MPQGKLAKYKLDMNGVVTHMKASLVIMINVNIAATPVITIFDNAMKSRRQLKYRLANAVALP